MTMIFRKTEKKYQKIAKSCVIKIFIAIPLTLETYYQSLKNSIASKNYAVNYYPTPEEAPWLLRLEKSKNVKISNKKLERNSSFIKKLLKFVILKT